VTKLAVIYKRVSTDEQAEKGYSLPHQSSECHRYAAVNDFAVLNEFSDDYSGATLERPGFSQLREFTIYNRVEAVIVYTADRLSRNIIDFLVIRDQWEKAGIELHFVDRGKSQNNFEGLLTDGIFALIAHGERLQIIKRTSNGRHNKAKRNRIVMSGTTPYGYMRKGEGVDAEYIIDPYESEIVRNIFDWYVNGYGRQGHLSLRAISNLLDKMGVLPPRHRSKGYAALWYPRTVYAILKNSIYTGISYYGKLKTENGRRTLRPEHEWTRIEVPQLAIITEEVFSEAEKRIARNKEISKRNRKRPYLMSGHFRCGACGSVMFGFEQRRPDYTRDYYRCCSYAYKNVKCPAISKSITASRVDTAIWDWVTALLENEDNLDEGIRAMVEKQKKEAGPKQERLYTMEGLIADADAKIQRLVDELSEYEGYTVRDVIREKIKSIENERGMLFDELEKLSKELEQGEISPDFEDQIRRTAAKIRGKLQGATLEDKRLILEALELQVLYFCPEKRTKILKISCIIPFAEGLIELRTSQRSLR
jgi:site-specific DNA recombinase